MLCSLNQSTIELHVELTPVIVLHDFLPKKVGGEFFSTLFSIELIFSDISQLSPTLQGCEIRLKQCEFFI